jgi:hypothetical protein
VSATIRRHRIVDLVIGNGCPFAVHLDLVMVTNPAALRRATVIEVAAGALAVVSVQPRVKLHMPLFVVHPVISFLRYRAYTQQYGDHADYRYPPFGGHFDQFGGRDRAPLRLYLSPFSALFLCRPGAPRAMTPALSRLAPSKTCSSAPNICSLRSHQFAPAEDVAANEGYVAPCGISSSSYAAAYERLQAAAKAAPSSYSYAAPYSHDGPSSYYRRPFWIFY